MALTIKDVAKKAGVSIATVSRVLNNKDRVKDETREKIMAIVNEMNYVTNFSAKTLRQNKSNVIGVIVQGVSISFYAEIVKGIENKANEYDLRLIVCDSENSVEKEKDFVRFLYDRSVDGMIFIVPQMPSEDIVKIHQDNYPIVVFGSNMQEYNIPSITVDNRLGAILAVRHLYSHGFTKIAFIGSIEDEHNSDRRERLQGYRDALKECQLELLPEYIENGLYYEETASGAFIRLMKLPNPPDAVFCGNDEMALGVLKTAKKMGISIPEQIGLVGFDNIRICQYTSPALTTINQPTHNIGVLCCEKLIYSLNDKGKDAKYTNLVLQPELIIRESCGC